MRQGIYTDTDGIRTVDIQKALGRGYNNGWFTNTRNIRYRLYKGARNTKKSVIMLGYEPILRMISDDITNILIVRKNDVDNRNSTFAGLLRAISDLGLEPYFKTRLQPLEIEHISGRKIIFAGLNNPTSLNSIAFKVGYLTAVYIEEAFEIDSWDAFVKLDQSVRAGMNYNEKGELVEINVPQQITMCFNAWSDVTWLYEEFFKGRLEDDVEKLDDENVKYLDYVNPDFVGPGGTGLYLHISTYKVNEFRNRKQVDVAAEEMRKTNYDYYKTLFLGCWGSAGDTTYPEFGDKNIINEDTSLGFTYTNFAIGIDTGLSAGDGSKIRIYKNEDGSKKVKSATVVELAAVVGSFEKLVILDEYYHSNDSDNFSYNTDGPGIWDINTLAEAVVRMIFSWVDKYRDKRKDALMKGFINVYVDSADIGFRQVLEIKAREMRLYNVRFYGSTKTSIQCRVDFERLMFSYNDFLIVNKCKNLIREFKASRRDPKTGLRENINDHAINSCEYGIAPFKNSFARWKNNFKE